MSEEVQQKSSITLPGVEMEAAAARVAERAGNLTVDGLSSFAGDVFGGLLGDRTKQWRNRNLVKSLSKTKALFDEQGIPIETAKALPMGELYAIFDGMSKQEDPHLSDMWAALLANAMKPNGKFTLDPSLPKVLEQLSGVDAVILKFYQDALALKAKEEAPTRPTLATKPQPATEYRVFIEKEGDKILELFDVGIVSSSISNLLRLGLLFVETTFDNQSELVSVGINRRSEFSVNDSGLRDELSHLYYRINLSADGLGDHKLTQFYTYGEQRFFNLPYDMTRLARRLIEACTAPS